MHVRCALYVDIMLTLYRFNLSGESLAETTDGFGTEYARWHALMKGI